MTIDNHPSGWFFHTKMIRLSCSSFLKAFTSERRLNRHLTGTGMNCPCRDRGTPRMKRPLKGHYSLTMTAALDLMISSSS